jgi:hypothetical protein
MADERSFMEENVGVGAAEDVGEEGRGVERETHSNRLRQRLGGYLKVKPNWRV